MNVVTLALIAWSLYVISIGVWGLYILEERCGKAFEYMRMLLIGGSVAFTIFTAYFLCYRNCVHTDTNRFVLFSALVLSLYTWVMVAMISKEDCITDSGYNIALKAGVSVATLIPFAYATYMFGKIFFKKKSSVVDTEKHEQEIAEKVRHAEKEKERLRVERVNDEISELKHKIAKVPKSDHEMVLKLNTQLQAKKNELTKPNTSKPFVWGL